MSTHTKTKALLVLENGRVFEGFSFGALGEKTGEVVFNTAMTGYQEIITDPSYKGQIVVMTYPQIGNTGINHFDDESEGIHLEGLIVKDYCDIPSSWRAEKTLHHFLQEFNVPGIFGIDTRQLTRILRTEGSLRGIISTQELDPNRLLAKTKNIPLMTGQNLAAQVSTSKIHEFKERPTSLKHHVIAFDFGIKTSILKRLILGGSRVTIVPCHTTAKEVLDLNPEGIFLSNGPGDPAAVTNIIPTLKDLIGTKPIFGICLGHQILALALGGKTHKLKFGHHGANHPVRNEKTKSIEITSQNHNFVVDLSSLPKTVQMTHTNLNDHTVEGFEDLDRKLFSVQYHPEASPGPHDSYYLFDQFTHLMDVEGQ